MHSTFINTTNQQITQLVANKVHKIYVLGIMTLSPENTVQA